MTTTTEQLVTKIGEKLKKREWKLATAESCTGGGLAYALTRISGSSEWFERGFVTYSNSAKEEMLGVSTIILAKFGAVSEETVREMAEGALQHSQAQVSVAITGIAGPTGGTPEKPVGTVWFAWAGINLTTKTQVYHLSGDRDSIREQSIRIALEELMNIVGRYH